MAFIRSILDQHADDAIFLYLRRRKAVWAPQYSLRDLIDVDYRLDANLDGLLLAEEVGWSHCNNLLEQEGEAGVFTAAVVAYSSQSEARIEAVLGAAGRLRLLRGIASSLGWLPLAHVETYIERLLAAESPLLHRVGIASAAAHRLRLHTDLLSAIHQRDLLLRSRALRAVGELGALDLADAAVGFLDSDDEAVRFAAAWSVALINAAPKAISVLKSLAESNSPYRSTAVQVALRSMDSDDAEAWHRHLVERLSQAQQGIAGAGAIGDPKFIAWLVPLMDQPRFARRAGEAFTMITGLDIAAKHLERQSPDGMTTVPSENPEDESVATDEEENLPWPDPKLILEWWGQHEGEFQKGTRYLLGKPISVDWCKEVLRNGRQRQRVAAALELAIRKPGQPLFNVTAPGFRQQQLLGLRH